MNEESKGKIIIYRAEDGKTTLEVSLKEDTVWLSLNQMVALFDRDKSVISRHIKNVFREGELDKRSVVAKFATTASDGKTYFLFVWFLDANGILYAKDGRKRIGDNALVALSLLIAESDPHEKDIIIKVIVNLINKDN